MASGGGRGHLQVRAAFVLQVALGMLSACGPGNDAGGGRLALRVTSAQTSAEGNRCVLDVQAHNDTGAAALNVQAAWMARTDGFGFISDYQVLGDFELGEERAVKFSIFGAPCGAVQEVELSRAVCTVGPVQTSPQSCADLVVLDASAIANVSRTSR